MLRALAMEGCPVQPVQIESRAREDAELSQQVRAAAARHPDAILWLLTRYRPPVVRLLTGLTGDLATAEDLAQETFLQVFRTLSQLRDPAAFHAWVRRLAVRTTLRHLKRAQSVSAASLPELATDRDPAAQVQTRLCVHAVLSGIPEELRTVLVLREMEQLDYQEIAELLAIPLGTVRSRLSTARQRFRSLWELLEGDGR